jgi:hypothetical protein
VALFFVRQNITNMKNFLSLVFLFVLFVVYQTNAMFFHKEPIHVYLDTYEKYPVYNYYKVPVPVPTPVSKSKLSFVKF